MCTLNQLDLFQGAISQQVSNNQQTTSKQSSKSTSDNVPMIPFKDGLVKATHEYTDEHGKKHYWHSYGRKPRWFDLPETKQISPSWRFD